MRIGLQHPGDFPHRLHHAQLAVYRADRHQHRIPAQQFGQLIQIDAPLSVDRYHIDLRALLLHRRQTAAHRRVFQRRGDNVPPNVAACAQNALDGRIVRLARAGGLDDLRLLRAKHLRHVPKACVQDFRCLSSGRMPAVRVADAKPLRFAKARQHPLVHRRVRRIIQINHNANRPFSKTTTSRPSFVMPMMDRSSVPTMKSTCVLLTALMPRRTSSSSERLSPFGTHAG